MTLRKKEKKRFDGLHHKFANRDKSRTRRGRSKVSPPCCCVSGSVWSLRQGNTEPTKLGSFYFFLFFFFLRQRLRRKKKRNGAAVTAAPSATKQKTKRGQFLFFPFTDLRLPLPERPGEANDPSTRRGIASRFHHWDPLFPGLLRRLLRFFLPLRTALCHANPVTVELLTTYLLRLAILSDPGGG